MVNQFKKNKNNLDLGKKIINHRSYILLNCSVRNTFKLELYIIIYIYMYMCILFLIPWQFYKNYTTILSSHPQHTILVLVLSLKSPQGGSQGGMKKLGEGSGGGNKVGRRVGGSNGGGEGGEGVIFKHICCRIWKTDITGASDGVFVFFLFLSYIDRNLSQPLWKDVVFCLFISVCVCFSWFGPVFNFTTHLRKKKKIRDGKEFPKSSSESVGIFFTIQCPSESNNILSSAISWSSGGD